MDISLVKRCIDGDRAAQELFYKTYARKVKGICLRYARSSFEAEDILQDAFIKIFKNLKNYNQSGPLDAWVRRIVLNTAIDSYKGNLFIKDQVSVDEVLDVEDRTFEVDSNIKHEELLNILRQLPEGYKMVFNLYAIEGYGHKEISEMLGISEGTSKSQLSKARGFIKDLLVKLKYSGDETEG